MNIDLSARPFLTVYTTGKGLEIGPGEYPWPVVTRDISYYDIRPHPELKNIVSECSPDTYDFVLASHVLEHLPNAIGGICEWLNALKIDGRLLLLVPEKTTTFDSPRDVTTFDHFLLDFIDPTFRKAYTMRHCYDWAFVSGQAPNAADAKAYIDSGFLHMHTWTEQSMKEFLYAIKDLVPKFEQELFMFKGIEMAIILKRVSP